MADPTIADIAARAGVSKAAVSYALNGRRGVSQATSERVHEIARELGWAPHSAARVLSGGRADVVGLAVARPARTFGLEPFFMSFISGLELELAQQDIALMLQLVPDHAAETQVYRRWRGQRRVDGVIVVDLFDDDDRLEVLRELGLPFLVVGDARDTDDVACVWTDEVAGMTRLVEYLAALGHRRVGRVSGLAAFRHTRQRSQAFHETTQRLRLEEVLVQSDYTGEDATRVTRALLAEPDPPTAIVYDSDLMAVAGLSVAAEMGIDVPRDLSVVSWDDSVLCELTHPALTALSHDATAYGAHAARRLLELVGGAPPAAYPDTAHVLVPRASTRPPQP